MSFKGILATLFVIALIIGALVLFFTYSPAVDTAQQSAEIIKDHVEGMNITEKSLNIWDRLFN